ncbi:hypothetical protein VNN41_09835 [Lactococcus garvieae]|uniref:hypothetical protein n=1 Tax=Lactococcus garvieae TaxID=1363 RepID=UPI003246498A
MSQKEKWELKNFSVKIKKTIQEMAEKKNMFANEFVEKVLEKYIDDAELEATKNYFDTRWQEVIDGLALFTDAQLHNTEKRTQDISELKTFLENQTESFEALKHEQEDLRMAVWEYIGIEDEEEEELDKLEKEMCE